MATTIKVDSVNAHIRFVNSQITKLDFSAPLKQCAMILVSLTKRLFNEQRSPEGQPWAPLAHPRVRGGNKILRDRGLLLASLTGRSNHVEKITSSKLEWGTNLNYASIHQHGGTITPQGHPFLAIPVTRKAYNAGSPRNFPGELIFRMSNTRRSAVFMTADKKKNYTVQYALVKEVHIPARPFLGLNQEMLDDCGEVLRRFVAKKLGGG